MQESLIKQLQNKQANTNLRTAERLMITYGNASLLERDKLSFDPGNPLCKRMRACLNDLFPGVVVREDLLHGSHLGCSCG